MAKSNQRVALIYTSKTIHLETCMFLAGVARKGRSISSPLSKTMTLPEQVEPERLEALTIKLRSGQANVDEINEIARGHIRLAFNVASRYAAAFPNLADDLVSCALFGVAFVIKHAAERMHDNNITPYIVTTMHHFCSEFVNKSKLLGVPHQTRHRYEARGQEAPKVGKVSYLDDSKNGFYSAVARDYSRANELREQINRCARNEIDRQILELREAGHTDEEIANIVDCTPQYIQKLRSELKRRFQQEKIQNASVKRTRFPCIHPASC